MIMMAGMKDVMDQVRAWDEAGVASAEAILAGVQHSSPRPAGARLVVNETGEVAGAVSMGCVEGDLKEHLMGLLRGEGAPRMVHYGASFGAALEVGLTCGGEIDVWLRRHDPTSAAWKGVCALGPASRAVLLTELAGDSRQVLLAPGEAPPEGLEEALKVLWTRGGVQKIAADGTKWLAETIEPDPHVLVVGASPISMALCELGTRTGFRVSIVDPRRDFARTELFPAAEAVVHRWPEEGLAEAGLDARSYVAVVAHDAKLDVPALSAALRAGARYIGLLGSAGTQADRRGQLAEAGFAPEEIARIRGPIGLKSIGALDPAEIAVAILAELIMARRGKLEPGGAMAP